MKIKKFWGLWLGLLLVGIVGATPNWDKASNVNIETGKTIKAEGIREIRDSIRWAQFKEGKPSFGGLDLVYDYEDKDGAEGRVGIGTDKPSKTLDVAGDINLTGNLYKSGKVVDLKVAVRQIGDSLVSSLAGPGSNGTSEGTESDLKNNFFGFYAGSNNTAGSFNNFLGYEVGRGNTTGKYNNFIGAYAGRSNKSGSDNIGIGNYAGTGTATHDKRGNFVTNNSVFLGSYARPKASDETNQIVIGYDAIGAGSDTVTIGNTNITKTVLRGAVIIGETSVSCTSSLAGSIRYDTPNMQFCDGTGWKDL